MSITDEIRKFVDRTDGYELWCPRHKTELLKIADRIDSRNARDVSEAYAAGVESVPIAIDESQWVKLPVDADGVPIHVGDEYACDGRTVKAMWLEYLGHGDWAVHASEGVGDYYEPFELHKIQPDSWERIITEAMRFARTTNVPYPEVEDVGRELVERCRRLAGAE